MRPVPLVLIGLFLFVTACASGGGSGSTAPGSDRNLISAEELAPLSTDDVYQAIRRLRANWLVGRGGSAPKVFIDGSDRGGPDILRDFRANEVREIRFVPSADATMRYGTGYSGGIIEVFMK